MQESEFTAAMERAVASRGEDYRYPSAAGGLGGQYRIMPNGNLCPTYSAPDGTPTCLIGVAMYEAGLPVPGYTEAKAANAVLDAVGLPHHVAMAGRVAQMAQDRNRRWGDALAMYRTALELQKERMYYGWQINDLFMDALHRTVLDGIGGAQKSMETFAKSVETLANVTIEFNLEPLASVGWIAPFDIYDPSLEAAPVSIMHKKDHALVA